MTRVVIRRVASGEWTVVRPGYGFGRGTVTLYATWRDAIRSAQFVGLGGAGSVERDSSAGYAVSA